MSLWLALAELLNVSPDRFRGTVELRDGRAVATYYVTSHSPLAHDTSCERELSPEQLVELVHKMHWLHIEETSRLQKELARERARLEERVRQERHAIACTLLLRTIFGPARGDVPTYLDPEEIFEIVRSRSEQDAALLERELLSGDFERAARILRRHFEAGRVRSEEANE